MTTRKDLYCVTSNTPKFAYQDFDNLEEANKEFNRQHEILKSHNLNHDVTLLDRTDLTKPVNQTALKHATRQTVNGSLRYYEQDVVKGGLKEIKQV